MNTLTIKANKFVQDIILPILRKVGVEDINATTVLLLGTAIQESGIRNIRQKGNGPARGYYQMEPAALQDLKENYIKFHPKLSKQLISMSAYTLFNETDNGIDTGQAQTLLAWANYHRHSEPLPKSTDFAGQAKYWKKYWNTAAGKGTEAQYIKNWEVWHEASPSNHEGQV